MANLERPSSCFVSPLRCSDNTQLCFEGGLSLHTYINILYTLLLKKYNLQNDTVLIITKICLIIMRNTLSLKSRTELVRRTFWSECKLLQHKWTFCGCHANRRT